jgi:hypothetical protein
MRRIPALILGACCLLGAAAPSRAVTVVGDNCQLTVDVLEGSGGTYAVVHLSSKYGFHTWGQLDLLVDDAPFKKDIVDTTTEFAFAVRIADPGVTVTACAVFQGRFEVYGDSFQLASASDCQSAQAILPVRTAGRTPGLRIPVALAPADPGPRASRLAPRPLRR